jgi:putative CocE/NonD family hydrolase
VKTIPQPLPGSPEAQPQLRFAVDRHVPVAMRDGTILRADVWRPDDEAAHPTLLQRSPYGKSPGRISIVDAGLDPLRAVEAGYVVVLQDTRGRFASDGRFDPFRDERADGADTIAWAAAQPWSDGQVGMYGGSYFGATQLLAAAETPPALRAITPVVTASEYYEGWTYQGGAFQLGFVLFWTLSALAPAEILRRPEGERPRLLEQLNALLADPWDTYRRLPLGDLGGLEELVPYYREWLEHDTRDSWWEETAPNEHYGSVVVPALHVGGWYDIFAAGTIENFLRLREEAGSAEARAGQRLFVGPWAHASYGDIIGQLEFGPTAAWESFDTTAWHLAWFEETLRGGESDSLPVRIFLMGANSWLEAEDWPPAGVAAQDWHLHSRGAANTSGGDGDLGRLPPGDEQPDRFTYDPADPVPTHGGATLIPGFLVGLHTGALDQRELELRSDVLVYTSEPLERDLDVIGSVQAVLYVSTSGTDTDFTAKLVDVHPTGAAYLICDGIRALRHRESLARVSPVEPGATYELQVALGPTANRFSRGHRLRLEVSSSNFPRFARNPNNGVAPTRAVETDLTPARQVLYHDAARPSRLVLPVRG